MLLDWKTYLKELSQIFQLENTAHIAPDSSAWDELCSEANHLILATARVVNDKDCQRKRCEDGQVS
jgi:hypothetical protein